MSNFKASRKRVIKTSKMNLEASQSTMLTFSERSSFLFFFLNQWTSGSVVLDPSFIKRPTVFYLFIYLFMAVLGLRFCARAFSSCGKWGPLFIVVRGASHYRGLSCCGAQGPDAQAQ